MVNVLLLKQTFKTAGKKYSSMVAFVTELFTPLTRQAGHDDKLKFADRFLSSLPTEGWSPWKSPNP